MNSKNIKIFKAGAAKVNITPQKGSIIGVDFLMHYARFIHDDLFAKALAISNGKTTFIFVVLDICIMPSDLMKEIKYQITHATGITPSHIMLSCTHTHGAGDVAGLLGGAVDIYYRNSLPLLVAKACEDACTAMQPAKITYGNTSVTGFQKCRRYKMKDDFVATNPVTGLNDTLKTNPFGFEEEIIGAAAPVDPYLGFLALKTYEGYYIAILANYAMHYAGDWDVDTITADYYGSFDRSITKGLQNKLPSFMGIMTYGCGADVNTWDFSKSNNDVIKEKPFQKTEAIGKNLSDAVIDALENCSWDKTPTLKICYSKVAVKIRKPNEEDLNRATKHLEENRFQNLKIDESGIKSIYARRTIIVTIVS